MRRSVVGLQALWYELTIQKGAFFVVKGAFEKDAIDEVIKGSKDLECDQTFDDEGQDVVEVIETGLSSDEGSPDRDRYEVPRWSDRVELRVDDASTLIYTEFSRGSGSRGTPRRKHSRPLMLIPWHRQSSFRR